MFHLAVTPYQLFFRKPAPTSRGMLTTRTVWFVRVWRSEAPDQVGWGESGPLPNLSRDNCEDFGALAEQFCARFNDAQIDSFDTAQTWVQQIAWDLPALAFGVEMALRDLRTGAQRRWWDTPFTRGESALPTHGLIWMDDFDGVLQQIETKIATGFMVIKLKIGAMPFEEELALLRTVRSAYPNIEIRLDANGAFKPAEALDRLDALGPLDIAFVEQPVRVGAWSVLADLCRHSPVPIALDEEMIPIRSPQERDALLSIVRPQFLIIKPTLLGGFAAGQKWIDEAETRNIRWIINSLLESNLGLNAICQWTSAIGGAQVHGLGTGSLFSNNIPSPLTLRGAQLQTDLSGAWRLPELAQPDASMRFAASHNL
ncbi:MAG: o-succinylbenzoate synthase [Caldilinea sp.]|nr:o-succinylbenzoate synthase [Caldilinea sp.]MDW8440633.1 o-succinylbenzoate synthase [Caldilineaceae bacterium]